jgi:hypothetical protein
MRSLDKGNMCLEKGCGFWIASLEKGSGIQPSYFVFELDSNSNCWRKMQRSNMAQNHVPSYCII